MNPIRGIMSRFYRDHGLRDPEAPTYTQLSAPRTAGAPLQPGVSTPDDDDNDDEIWQLKQEIDDFTHKSARQLQEFRLDLATQLQTMERVQQESIRAKEAALNTQRLEQSAELTRVEVLVVQQERRLTDDRLQILQNMQERLRKAPRDTMPPLPERVCREASSRAMSTVVIRSAQRQWAEGLVTWLETERVAERLAAAPSTEEAHIRACPLLRECSPLQLRELLCIIKTLPASAWRNHVSEFARVMA